MTPAAPPWTLGCALHRFRQAPSVRILGSLVLGLSGLRLWVGSASSLDLFIPLTLLALQPVTEWLIHVFLLHWRPRTLLGLRLDTVAARDHRRHHSRPTELPLVFIPLPTLLATMLFLPLPWFVLAPSPGLAVTGLLSTAVIGLGYEWVHFCCHIPRRPRSAWMQSRMRHHRLHHHKNEHYWFGVTLHLADLVLRTRPDPATVPRSETARALHAQEQT